MMNAEPKHFRSDVITGAHRVERGRMRFGVHNWNYRS